MLVQKSIDDESYGALHWTLRRSVVGSALLVNLVVSLILMPITANPFDFALISGIATSWMNWHMPLFLYWKFGADYALLNLLAACGARVLSAIGLSIPAAAHTSFKLMLITANVLAALAIWKLATRFRPRQAGILTSLWLLSPVVIWTAAFHGQIEPIAVATTFWSFWLMANKKWFLAGVVTGVGVGFEFIPLVALVALAALVISRKATILDATRYVVALAMTLIASFSQVFFNSTAATSLSQGLIGHATASGADIVLKPGSIWYLGGAGLANGLLEPHWLFLLAGVAVLTALIAAWNVNRGSDAAPYAAAGVTLLAATFLDPTTLPQFGVLAIGGLCLMSLEIQIPTVIIAATSALPLLAYAFVQPMYVYFEDVDPAVANSTSTLLPQLPVTPSLYPALATIGMELGIFAVGIWLLESIRTIKRRPLRRPPTWIYKEFAGVISVSFLVLLLVLVWSVQPQLWSGVIGSNPSALFDARDLTSRRMASVTTVTGTTVSGQFDSSLLNAVGLAKPSPVGLVEYSPNKFASQLIVGWRTKSDKIQISIPMNRDEKYLTVTRIGIELLVHNQAWTDLSTVDGRASINGQLVVPTSVRLDIPTWAELDYQVSPMSRVAGTTAQIFTIALLAHHTYLNADKKGAPWFLAWYSAGSILTGNRIQSHWSRFLAPTQSQGQIFLKSSEVSRPIDIPSLSSVSSNVLDVAFSWPSSDKLNARPQNPWQWLAGLLYLLMVSACLVFASFLCFKSFKSLGLIRDEVDLKGD